MTTQTIGTTNHNFIPGKSYSVTVQQAFSDNIYTVHGTYESGAPAGTCGNYYHQMRYVSDMTHIFGTFFEEQQITNVVEL